MHVEIVNPRWRRKRSRHSLRLRNPHFYVSGKRPLAASISPIGYILLRQCLIYNPHDMSFSKNYGCMIIRWAMFSWLKWYLCTWYDFFSLIYVTFCFIRNIKHILGFETNSRAYFKSYDTIRNSMVIDGITVETNENYLTEPKKPWSPYFWSIDEYCYCFVSDSFW